MNDGVWLAGFERVLYGVVVAGAGALVARAAGEAVGVSFFDNWSLTMRLSRRSFSATLADFLVSFSFPFSFGSSTVSHFAATASSQSASLPMVSSSSSVIGSEVCEIAGSGLVAFEVSAVVTVSGVSPAAEDGAAAGIAAACELPGDFCPATLNTPCPGTTFGAVLFAVFAGIWVADRRGWLDRLL